MNWTLYIPAHNCCDINVCKISCMMIGHLTLIGWLFIILSILIMIILVNYLDKYIE